jgi:hypothetical protein
MRTCPDTHASSGFRFRDRWTARLQVLAREHDGDILVIESPAGTLAPRLSRRGIAKPVEPIAVE